MNPDSGEVPGIDVRLTAFSSGLQVCNISLILPI